MLAESVRTAGARSEEGSKAEASVDATPPSKEEESVVHDEVREYGLRAESMSERSLLTSTFSDRRRKRRYAEAVSSKSAPSANVPCSLDLASTTADEVREATSVTDIAPATFSPLFSLRWIRVCNSDQSSTKNTSSPQSCIFFSRYSALPKIRQSLSRPAMPSTFACSSELFTVRPMVDVMARYASKAECRRSWNWSRIVIWISIRNRSFWLNDDSGWYRSVIVSRRSLTRIAAFVGLVAEISTPSYSSCPLSGESIISLYRANAKSF